MLEDAMVSKPLSDHWITGFKETRVGKVPVISTRINWIDILGGIAVRVMGSMRETYRIRSGLYSTGNPDESSPVLVTSNYKLTFDNFRKELNGIDCWILVIDTGGINVWCAAGKGTFGTQRVIEWIRRTGLRDIVSHSTIILPQLAAPGIRAHEVKRESGFRVVYGPVRARDIAAFLENKLRKDRAMRTVAFGLNDRLVLIPMELTISLPVLITGFIVIFITDWIIAGSINMTTVILNYVPFLSAVVAGSVLVPILLPYIPARSFILKGLFIGMPLALVIISTYQTALLDGIAYFLNVTTTSCIFALTFTGATTFTSVSGVRREVKIKLFVLFPLFIFGMLIALISKMQIV